MRFSEVVGRVNGISTPIFGVQWTPPVSDVAVARRILSYVSDRRVLFSTYTAEVPAECVQSVLEIREFLTTILGTGGIGENLSGPVSLMRRYCRQFLDRVGATEPRYNDDASGRFFLEEREYRMFDYWFGEALGELRQAVGLQIALIATVYGLDVEDDLAKVLPPAD